MTAQVQEFTVEARDIGTDGSLMIVIGEYDDAFLTGRVDEHYDPLDGIPYLIEETIKDIEQIMWWKLQNPPQLDENGNELETPPRSESMVGRVSQRGPLRPQGEFRE